MERNFIGYGQNLPRFNWPNMEKVAINFVINYEEGAELSPVNDDENHEVLGGEFPLSQHKAGVRHYSMESLYEYGARRGVWKLLKVFDDSGIATTFFACGHALSLNPPLCEYLSTSQHEIAGHGWRWFNYAFVSKEVEREHIKKTIHSIHRLTGKEVKGWYTGRKSENTRNLLFELDGIVYDSDSYADDLPFFYPNSNHLIIPYNLDCNDFRYTTSPGFSSSEDFYLHLKNAFDYCYASHHPELLTIGLHPRISGRASRMRAITKFLEYISQYKDLWFCTRHDLALRWLDMFVQK